MKWKTKINPIHRIRADIHEMFDQHIDHFKRQFYVRLDAYLERVDARVQEIRQSSSAVTNGAGNAASESQQQVVSIDERNEHVVESSNAKPADPQLAAFFESIGNK